MSGLSDRGFGVQANRPRAVTVSPLRLGLLGVVLVAMIAGGFIVPTMMQPDPNGEAHGSNRDGQASLPSRCFGFEDAPRHYGEIRPVSIVRTPEVTAPAPLEPQVIIKEVIREVPAPIKTSRPSKQDVMNEAARLSPVTFDGLSDERDGTITMLGPRTLPAGHRLKSRLDGAVNSETPGLMTATVIEDPRGLVVTGSKLIGRYHGTNIRFTGSRLAIAFTELQMRDRAFSINAQAADAGGRAGLDGDVDRHIGALIGLSALNVVSGAAIGTTARRGDDFEAALDGESIREGARLSRDIGRQVLDVAPTIEIPAGTEFWVVLLDALKL